jgi:hypothetical protein
VKLYDFSVYAKRRDELRSAKQIEELVPRLNEPGMVIQFKARVESWLELHKEVLRKAS